MQIFTMKRTNISNTEKCKVLKKLEDGSKNKENCLLCCKWSDENDLDEVAFIWFKNARMRIIQDNL